MPYVVFMKFTVFDAYSNMTCIREERTLLIFGLQPALTLLCVFLNPESQSGADCMSFPSLTIDGVGGQSLVHIYIQQRIGESVLAATVSS